jgi:hypothetical protein
MLNGATLTFLEATVHLLTIPALAQSSNDTNTTDCGEHGTYDPRLDYCKCDQGWSQPNGAVRSHS